MKDIDDKPVHRLIAVCAEFVVGIGKPVADPVAIFARIEDAVQFIDPTRCGCINAVSTTKSSGREVQITMESGMVIMVNPLMETVDIDVSNCQ